jgi:hypothetical protein
VAPRRAFAVAAIAFLLGSLVATAGPAYASSYNDTNPGTTVCGDGSHTVETARKFYIRMGSSVLARLELRWSDYCDTVWAKVVNLTGSGSGYASARSLTSDETIYVYSCPYSTCLVDSQTEFNDVLLELPRFHGR